VTDNTQEHLNNFRIELRARIPEYLIDRRSIGLRCPVGPV
jgi:hypothetical protein